MTLFFVFIITLASGLIAISGGNGLVLMPSLLMLNFHIKEILVVIRISAVVFVLFNLFAMMKEKEVPIVFNRHDLWITLISCVSILVCVPLLANLNDTSLMLFISFIIIILFFLIICKPSGEKHKKFFSIFLPIFAGICGSEVGGAGLIITVLYTLLGSNHIEATKRRIIPSLIIQIVAFVMLLLMQHVHFNYTLLMIVVIATAISGYLNTKIFFKLSTRSSKILFYFSFIFALSNLLWRAIKDIIWEYDHWGLIDTIEFMFSIHT
jgi:uncharacterized membrane protein YfcA